MQEMLLLPEDGVCVRSCAASGRMRCFFLVFLFVCLSLAACLLGAPAPVSQVYFAEKQGKHAPALARDLARRRDTSAVCEWQQPWRGTGGYFLPSVSSDRTTLCEGKARQKTADWLDLCAGSKV